MLCDECAGRMVPFRRVELDGCDGCGDAGPCYAECRGEAPPAEGAPPALSELVARLRCDASEAHAVAVGLAGLGLDDASERLCSLVGALVDLAGELAGEGPKCAEGHPLSPDEARYMECSACERAAEAAAGIEPVRCTEDEPGGCECEGLGDDERRCLGCGILRCVTWGDSGLCGDCRAAAARQATARADDGNAEAALAVGLAWLAALVAGVVAGCGGAA